MSDDDKRYKSYNDFDTRGKWPFGGSGAADEVPTPTGESCLRINQLLARAEVNAGEYSFGGRTEQLPPVPGLFVKNVGPISVPLSEESAQKLIAMCEISPFGRKLETLVDENVRKSWQLESNQVELKNPMWQKGIEELTTEIADRLGYKGVSLKCVLYKLLVYGEGGHFTKHKDTEKEDGMIATLVIQPPSMHEGGDLVVFRDTSTEYRHDFGKKDGTASFVTHYAVHYADAEHALEEVTKGYRLALVYSICLPPAMPEIHRDDKYQPLIEDLANAINGMRENAGAHEEEEESSDDDVDFDDDIDPDDDGFFYDGDEFEGDSFSLLLSHQG
ncbi:hypothetical protein PHYBOEH_010100 [Phytophthora boehmeriae]|uniref:Fe2OG dioxygenase domain-containing protein n=1 Tax=Phytophthora boehmeriae TaxID=109152 RepID=A0A8T1VS28_9STRA|nr:hypothetical protein PHYBOEH_010100 [Phytophthora boehmeriae]